MACRLTKILHPAAAAAHWAQSLSALGFSLDRGGALNMAGGVEIAPGDTATLGLDVAALPASSDAAACCFSLAAPSTAPAPAHRNGVVGLDAVALIAEAPADHAEFLSRLTGQREMVSTSAGLDLTLDNVRLEVLTPPAFAFRYGVMIASAGPALGGVAFRVKNLPQTEEFLRQNGFEPRHRAGRLLLGARDGLALAFAPAKSEF